MVKAKKLIRCHDLVIRAQSELMEHVQAEVEPYAV